MWTIQRNLMFATVCLTLLPAQAEERVSDRPPVFVVEGQSEGARVNDADPLTGATAVPRGDPLRTAQSRERLATESASGLRWTFDGQRPSLNFRFSDSGVMRLRGKSRGLEVSASWEF